MSEQWVGIHSEEARDAVQGCPYCMYRLELYETAGHNEVLISNGHINAARTVGVSS